MKTLAHSRILQESNGNNKMTWGLRTGSPPISFQDNLAHWQGFCPSLIDLLDKYLKGNQFLQNNVSIDKTPIAIKERFQHTRFPYQDDIHLAGECGSDSVRQNETGIKFSQTFFITKTLLLIRKSQNKKLSFLKNHTPPNLSNNSRLKIGVIDTSVTPYRLQNFFNYLTSEIEIVKIKDGKAGAIDALKQGKVDAFANDEILLKEFLKELEIVNPNEFYIDSDLVISYESYGLILPSDDPEWIKIINKFFIDKKDDIAVLIKKHTTDPNPPVTNPTPTPTPTPITKSSGKPISNIILLMIIVAGFGLTLAGYMYWFRRQNSSPEIKPNLHPKTPIFANGYGLLIGVGKSAYQPLSLPVTVKDVQALHQVLIDPNFCAYPNDTQYVRLLHDEEATRSKILEQLNWLKEQAEANPKATVVVYYSGHGWFNKSENLYYLLPHDINPFDLKSSSLSAEDFTTALRQIKSERLLVIIDSCHAAGMATAKKAPSDFEEIPIPKSVIDNLKQGKGRVVFTSSQGEESSWIRPDKQMSIYTYHLIEAMKGEANQAHENIVKISHLMKHLSHQVPVSARTLCQEEQTPYFSVESEDFPVALLKGRRPN
ncbi:caspase family protein [Nostoc sp. JL33]|uniref:caspase family protein n=1 Tax=Nostoc sp. JL33 TaxID=2815396 RepID=UPI0025E8A4E5|nr:caspase family protein [Nostoc sp. JL33]MBN3872899.1 caspase family protein [Nostoc sp. JL33]